MGLLFRFIIDGAILGIFIGFLIFGPTLGVSRHLMKSNRKLAGIFSVCLGIVIAFVSCFLIIDKDATDMANSLLLKGYVPALVIAFLISNKLANSVDK